MLGTEYLTSGVKAKELCEEAEKRRGEARRMKVMRDLWEMDGGDPGMKLQKWKEILSGKNASEDDDENTRRVEMASGFREYRRKSPDPMLNRHIVQIHDEDNSLRSHERKRKKKKKKVKREDKNLTESLEESCSKKVEKAALSIGSKKKSSIEEKEEELMKCLEEIEQRDENLVEQQQQIKDGENTTDDLSVTFSSHNKKNHHSKKSNGEDFFVEVIIDELKRENSQLKQKLHSRETQLTKAAENVKETLEENARLARKLEKALGRASEHAENFGEEMMEKESKYKRKIEKLQRKIEDMERDELVRSKATMDESAKIIELLKNQLEESEDRNKNLRDYIEGLKQSYLSVFDSKE